MLQNYYSLSFQSASKMAALCICFFTIILSTKNLNFNLQAEILLDIIISQRNKHQQQDPMSLLNRFDQIHLQSIAIPIQISQSYNNIILHCIS